MNNNVIITEALQRLNKMSRMSDSKSLKESTSRKRRLKESADSLWYGIPGIKFIWINSTADPLIEYKGKKINSHIVEDAMWDRYCEDGGDDRDLDAFGDYMRDNAYDVYELCELAINPDYYDESYNRRLKESIRRVLRRMNEAQMSPEDEEDSAILRGIFNKRQNRRNAKLTGEEIRVLNKYDLLDDDDFIYYFGNIPGESGYQNVSLTQGIPTRGYWKGRAQGWKHEITNDKINLADRARKIPQRGRGYRPAQMAGGPDYSTTLDAERALQNITMRQPYNNMKDLLASRRKAQTALDGVDARYDAEMARLAQQREIDRRQSKANVDARQADIDAMLRRPKKEESYRRKSARRFKR